MHERVFFLHLMKCAGTSFTHYLESRYSLSDVRVDPGLDIEPHSVNWTDNLDRGLVAGHIPLSWLSDHNDMADCLIMTFVRDPVSRFLSHYWFNHSRRDHLLAEGWREEDVDRFLSQALEEFLQDEKSPLFRLLVEHQARMVAGEVADFQGPVLDGAKYGHIARLSTPTQARLMDVLDRVDFIGCVESMEESILLIADRMGWPAPEVAPRLNVTREKGGSDDLSPEIRERIESLTRLDGHLYAAAVRRFQTDRTNRLVHHGINSKDEGWMNQWRQAINEQYFRRLVEKGPVGPQVLSMDGPLQGVGFGPREEGEHGSFRWLDAASSAWIAVALKANRSYFIDIHVPHHMGYELVNSLSLSIGGRSVDFRINRTRSGEGVVLRILFRALGEVDHAVRLRLTSDRFVRPCSVGGDPDDGRLLSSAVSRIVVRERSLARRWVGAVFRFFQATKLVGADEN